MALENCKPILIVDDDHHMRSALSASLEQQGYTVLSSPNGKDALRLCQHEMEKGGLSLILTDMKMPQMSGNEFCHHARSSWPQVPLVMMSAFGTVQGAVEAMKLGISDYLVKPFSEDRLNTLIQQVLSRTKGEGRAVEKPVFPKKEHGIVTEDHGMKQMLKMAGVVAASQATVLIEAESGTGKELLARFIHDRSPRAHRPFVAINCAAVPETLLESELFGFEKGAFSGAAAKKLGRFELAQGGTLLLDEVGEMHISLQAKLLRVLQEREVDVLGGKGPLSIDIRVIATTNRSLLGEVQAGRFREDLYYRLNVFPLRIPPLRERLGDIPSLVKHFIKVGSDKSGKPTQSVHPEALSILMRRPWPGNVREFENVMERAILLSNGEEITPDHLLFTPRVSEKGHATEITTVWEAERTLILETLVQVAGNRTHAARRLGISIRTLRNKLREYHRIDPDCEASVIRN